MILLTLLLVGCGLTASSPPNSKCSVTVEKCDHCELTCEHEGGTGAKGEVGNIPTPAG